MLRILPFRFARTVVNRTTVDRKAQIHLARFLSIGMEHLSPHSKMLNKW